MLANERLGESGLHRVDRGVGAEDEWAVGQRAAGSTTRTEECMQVVVKESVEGTSALRLQGLRARNGV